MCRRLSTAELNRGVLRGSVPDAELSDAELSDVG